MRSLFVLLLASPIFAADIDWLAESRPIQSPPAGRLLSRETFDLNGKRVGLEWYTDAQETTPRWATKTQTAVAAQKTQVQGGALNVGPTVQSPIQAPPIYTHHGGLWWKWNGSKWDLAETARSVPQSPFGTMGTTAHNAVPLSMSWPDSIQMAPTRIYAPPVMQAGDTNGGG